MSADQNNDDSPSTTSAAAARTVRSDRHAVTAPTGKRLGMLSLLALGVVFGDIGTSPLYAMNECFFGPHPADARDIADVLGVLSLITWSLILSISILYCGVILRADHRGEGGILALGALALDGLGPKSTRVLTVIALLGAAFLYSDGMITPAISVLSAVEGLRVAAPALAPYVVPATLVIIVVLFLFQRHGTARVGLIFGPVMIVYFTTIAALGVASIARSPDVLAALSPLYAIEFLLRSGWHGFLVLGGVFLAVTGAEALYADLGHFGKRPIRLAWFVLVLPALLMNYFGQAALLEREPTLAQPYYHLAPDWFQLPLVVLSSAAAVIASQAVISGTFSLTAQAMQLGYCPRLQVRHTSDQTQGQIYLPEINWLLMLACLGLVVGFGSSTNLAAAYGVSIATTMVLTTFLLFFVARRHWRWPLPVALAVTGAFFCIDLAFFSSNVVKIVHGGWFPVAMTAVIFAVMTTWKLGRRQLSDRLRQSLMPLEPFLADVATRPPIRVPGVAVFLSGNGRSTPGALLHNLKHNKVLHQRVVVMTVRTEPVARVMAEDRARVVERGNGFYNVDVRFGYKEDQNIPAVLAALGHPGLEIRPLETSYFLGRETLLRGRASGMAGWRRVLFIWLSRNSLNAAAFFSLPPNRVVELGMHVEI